MKKLFTRFSVILLLFVFAISCGESEGGTNITILHMNDTHGRDAGDMRVDKKAEPPTTNYFAGAPRRATYIKEMRESITNTLLLHGGDLITGSPFSTVFKGSDEIDIMNMIGFDYSTIGNHEFDYGMENFNKLMNTSEFPFLSVNLKNKKTGEPLVDAYTTIEIDGVSIAIIGITTSDAVYSPEVMANVMIEDEIESLKALLETTPLNTTNDVTILLSHVGVSKDKEIAEAMPNVFDIIVGGHSHTKLDKAVVVGNTKIVQANYYGLHVGRIDLTIKDGKITKFDYALKEMDSTIEENAEMLSFVASMQEKISKEFDVRIGTLPMNLVHENIRLESTPLGSFASDLVLDAYPNAEIVIMNSGSLRTALPDGTITLGKIQNEFFPYDNEVVLVDLSGAIIKEMLTISGTKMGSGAFLQFARGMEVTYKKDGTFVKATLNGESIDDNKNYAVVVSSFVFGGGDGYIDEAGNPLASKGENVVNTGNDMRDAMINNIKKLDNIPATYIDEKPRIIFE